MSVKLLWLLVLVADQGDQVKIVDNFPDQTSCHTQLVIEEHSIEYVLISEDYHYECVEAEVLHAPATGEPPHENHRHLDSDQLPAPGSG